jgi:hypothetical protein
MRSLLVIQICDETMKKEGQNDMNCVTYVTLMLGIITLYSPVLSTGWRFSPQCTKIVR